MAQIGLKVENLRDFCRLVDKVDFMKTLHSDSIFLRIEEEIPLYPPKLSFNHVSDVDFGNQSPNDLLMHGPLHPMYSTRKDTFIVNLCNATLIPDSFCLLNSKGNIIFPNTYLDISSTDMSYYSERSAHMSTIRKVRSKEDIQIEYFLEDSIPEVLITEPCVLLSSQSSANIYHWLIESVPRLWILDVWPEIKNMKFIVHNSQERKVAEIADKLGINRSNFVSLPPNARYKFKNLLFPSAINDLANTSAKFNYIRKLYGIPTFEDVGPCNDHSLMKKYYMTRRDTVGRHVYNEAELLECLNRFGVEELVMSSHSIESLVGMFSKANLLIGPMGSALINMIFMPPGSSIVELATKQWSGLFWTMGSGCRHSYYVLGSEADYYHSSHQKVYGLGMPDFMEYDVRKVKDVVESILRT